MSIRKWYQDKSFLWKYIVMYLLCAVIPMVFVVGYNYVQTRNLLVEQAYSDMRQDIGALENSMNSSLQPYAIIMRTIENDKSWNTQLSLDYTDLSYSDIAYYTDTELDDILVMYPSAKWLRFYSSNETLPDDNYYFFLPEEIDESCRADAENARGRVIVSGCNVSVDQTIVMMARMNYYGSELIHNYIAMGIDCRTVDELLYQSSTARAVYLTDAHGTILASSDSTSAGEMVHEILPEWEQKNTVGRILTQKNASGNAVMSLSAELDYGMMLIVTVDSYALLSEAGNIPKAAVTVFAFISIMAGIVAMIYSQSQNTRLQQLIRATEDIGHGDFRKELPDMGKDEFGQMAIALNRMNHQIDDLIHDNYEKQLRIKTSEMNLLQEQINPHFLYNALAVISLLSMQEGGKRTVQSVRYLADFYRMSLSKGKQQVTVREEVELLENYMKIQLLRFSDTLSISYDVAEDVLPCKTIKLLLQPLVENAIHHGREEEKVLTIAVRAWRNGERICFEVEDDGAGIARERLDQLKKQLAKSEDGFGLKNVDIRTKLYYGENYGVTVSSETGKGTLVHIEIPYML